MNFFQVMVGLLLELARTILPINLRQMLPQVTNIFGITLCQQPPTNLHTLYAHPLRILSPE